MSLRIDPDALLATVRALRHQAQRVTCSPLPGGDDPAVVRAGAVATAVAADLLDLADRLDELLRDVALREEEVAAECVRLGVRWRR
jgi:hypothetical protein